MNNNTTKMGQQIITLRKERGYTQESLAELLDVSSQAVSKWENGHSLPDTAILPSLAKALDCSIDSLFSLNSLLVLEAWYGDGINKTNVTKRLNRFVESDSLRLKVTASEFTLSESIRLSYLLVKYQNDKGIFYQYAKDGDVLDINENSDSYPIGEPFKIITGSYGTAKKHYDVMRKIEHYDVFRWGEYHANHETFPSNPANDEKEYLTLVCINSSGIHIATCGEGESIAYSDDRTELFRKTGNGNSEHYIPNVGMLPPFGGGMECSWAAALTTALNAMGARTSYEQVMGVSGACYRLAFCSPQWDYSSVDGLVVYDYAMPGYRAFGYSPKCVGRIEKEERATERQNIVSEIKHNMPVLAINIRVAPEWGVICGYKNNGDDLFCRTKYDTDILNSAEFVKGGLNPYDYLYVDNWPFIIIYFAGKVNPPSDRENLINSLKVFIDCVAIDRSGGYYTGFKAYEVWIDDLRNDEWYASVDDGQIERRFSVNQFCTLSLYDARQSAYVYLEQNKHIIGDVDKLAEIFKDIADKVSTIHKMLDAGEYLQGEKARRFWTKELRLKQASILGEVLDLEKRAWETAKSITEV